MPLPPSCRNTPNCHACLLDGNAQTSYLTAGASDLLLGHAGAHATELKDTKCTPEQMENFCGGPVGPAPRVGPSGEKTPPPGSDVLFMRSTDSGATFSDPVPINVTNTWVSSRIRLD